MLSIESYRLIADSRGVNMVSIILSVLLGCESMKPSNDCVDCDTASIDPDTGDTEQTQDDSGDTDTEDTDPTIKDPQHT